MKRKPITLLDHSAKPARPYLTVRRALHSRHFAIIDRDTIGERSFNGGRLSVSYPDYRWKIVHIPTRWDITCTKTLAHARLLVARLESKPADCWKSSDRDDYRCTCTGCRRLGRGAYLAEFVRESYTVTWRAVQRGKRGAA